MLLLTSYFKPYLKAGMVGKVISSSSLSSNEINSEGGFCASLGGLRNGFSVVNACNSGIFGLVVDSIKGL